MAKTAPATPEESCARAIAQRDWRTAASAVLELAAADATFRACMVAGDAATQRKDFVEAETRFRDALGRWPLHRGGLARLGTALLGQQRHGLAGLSLYDALVLGEFSGELLSRLGAVAASMGKRDAGRATERARAYWDADPGQLRHGLDAPLLSREVQDLARVMLGHELPGDEAYDVMYAAGRAADVAVRLAGHPSFSRNNAELLAMLVETGRAA